MPDHIDARRKLEALADPLPYRNSRFHLGKLGNQNSLELEYGQMLYGCMIAKRPEYVVELGTSAGYSATWILLGLERNESGRLWTVDPQTPMPAVWDDVGCPTGRLVLVNGLTSDVYKELPEKIDILFNDASHNLNDILSDIEALSPRIPVGGVILTHDVNLYRPMGDGLAKWFEEKPEEWSYQEHSESCGMGIATRLAVPEKVIEVKPKKAKRRVKR